MLEDQAGKTRLTLEYPGMAGISATDRSDMEQGWNESLDKLAASLK